VDSQQHKRIAYFDKVAQARIRKRRISRYYWNDITGFCNYFSHEDISVLEVGCGSGELLEGIAAKRKVGIDFSPAMIEAARQKQNGIEYHLRKLPLLKSSI
jgi:ubiquinone/menaquinone biosynthesis C-methylase UbiE